MLAMFPFSFPGACMFLPFILNQAFIRCSCSPVDPARHQAEPIQSVPKKP